MPSSEIGLSLDSTRSPPVTPLPAPTTVSSRSLRPRRSRGRSSARSSAVSSSRSRSHSVAGASQPLYHEDADNPERRAEPQDFTLRHIATISEGSSVDTDASITHVGVVSSPSVKGPGGSSMQAKRRRSVSPVADGSGSGGRRGKRRVLQDTGLPADSTIEQTEESTPTCVSPEATSVVGSLEMSFPARREPNATETPAAQISKNAHFVSDDPQTASERLVEERSSIPRAHDATKSTFPSASGTLNTDGAGPSCSLSLEYSTIPPLPGMSTRTESLAQAVDQGLLPSSPRQESIDTPTTLKANAQTSRLSDTVPIDEVEPLAAYTCPICFSPPTFATITPCGHVLCGECLFTAVKTTIQRGAYTLPPGERMTARCPVCRAPIPGWDGKGGGVIGLRPRAVFSL